MGIVKNISYYCNVSPRKVRQMVSYPFRCCELTLVLKGSLTYIISGKQYVLNKDDAIFLTPGCIRGRLPVNDPASYVSFNFHLNQDIKLDTHLKGILNGEIKKLISVLPKGPLTDSFHSREKIENILNCILYEIIDNIGFKSQNPHIIKILKYIEANLSQNLTLSQISSHVNLTREYTANLFKKETGKTIIDYINERKMIIAKNIIDSGELCLKDVANSLGFENYSYFSKLFKKYYGIPPVKQKNT